MVFDIVVPKEKLIYVCNRPLEESDLLTEATGKIWYDKLVGGITDLDKKDLPEGAMFGLDFKSTFRINTQVYLNW